MRQTVARELRTRAALLSQGGTGERVLYQRLKREHHETERVVWHRPLRRPKYRARARQYRAVRAAAA
jgi:hypothetical protein